MASLSWRSGPAYAYCDATANPAQSGGDCRGWRNRTAVYSRPNSDVDWHHCPDRRSGLFVALCLALGLTAFVLIKTQHHSSEWYCRFVTVVSEMPEVLGFWRMAGEYDYLMRVQVADMKRYDDFYKRLVNSVPGLSDVTSSFAMEQIKYTTSLPIE
ncbi:transcriptional regulator, AsnC family [Staphylococcus aureus subsp. aureus 21320]|nr:transcriptional regulator, AsnC family [Staphylococcus aureus subsp. aureus 21320]